MSNIQLIESDIYAIRPKFEAVLADSGINFEREAGFAIQTLQSNSYAMSVATQNRQSVIDAVTNVAAIGISLNPAKKQAYLVPRDRKICLDISYMGLMDLAIQSGSLSWVKAAVVHEADSFELSGYDSAPLHKFNPFSGDRGPMVGVYVVAKTADGDYLTHTMTTAEVNAIRDRSSAWKAFKSKGVSCPWATDYSEMAKKTCVKQASKYWPRTDRLREAIKHLDDEGEGLADLHKNVDQHRPAAQDDYAEFESQWLQLLRDAAMQGVAAYQAAIKQIPQGANKDRLGSLHHRNLVAAARSADQAAQPQEAQQ